MATQGNVSRAASFVGTRSSAPTRRVFTTRLVARVQDGGQVSRAWGTARIIANDDDSFEYLVTIYNPRGETFTAGEMFRSADSTATVPVASLFAEVALRDQFLQLRGTVTVHRGQRPPILSEEVREAPSSFYIVVSASGRPSGALTGRLE